MAREGASVAVADLRLEAAQETVSCWRERATRPLPLVRRPRSASVEGAVNSCVERFGRIDLLHNNAGVLIPAPPSRNAWRIGICTSP